MMFTLGIVLSVFYFWGSPFLPPNLELPKKINSVTELDPYLENAVSKNAPPNISIAVIGKDKPLYFKSYGYADSLQTQKASNQTVYQWWSLTKIFTAIAVLQLEEKGLVHIDDPVVKHLPAFDVRNLKDQSRPITIRQLLSHTSGLGDIGMSILGWVHFENDPHVSQTDLLSKIFPKYNKLDTQPGQEGNYSNLGYIVLAALIEKVSGRPYEAYILNNILKPLKMNQTDFIYSDAMRAVEATGSHPKDFISRVVPIYLDTKRAVKEETNGVLWFNRLFSDQKGSTGLIGSVDDMGRFMRMLLNRGELEGVRILSQANIEKMQEPIIAVSSSPAPDPKNLFFGLSWFIESSSGEKTLAHGGAGMAFVTLLKLYPEKGLGVVVFANSTYLGRTMGLELVELLGHLNWQ